MDYWQHYGCSTRVEVLERGSLEEAGNQTKRSHHAPGGTVVTGANTVSTSQDVIEFSRTLRLPKAIFHAIRQLRSYRLTNF